MACSLLTLMNYVLLLFLFTTGTSFSRKGPATSSCNFCITQIKTYNMETTIYWKSNFSHQDTTIQYVPQYNCDVNWTSVPCPRPQWHKNSGEMSCVLLTCATTKVDGYCEIRVEAHGNSSVNFVSSSALHNPTTENIPSRITDVSITSNSSTSAIISWRRPVDFCAKSKYCLEFKYHRQGAKLNKSVSVPSQNMNSTSVAGLDSCSAKYLFYLIVYEDELCSMPVAARWTTGPFVLPSLQISSCNFCITQIKTYNMETTIYWKSNFSHQDTTIQYVPQYNCDVNWTSVPCPRPQWHKNSCEMSCVVLTCATTKVDEYCEIRVEAHGNSSENFVSSPALHNPTTENIPSRITDVSITSNSSTSAIISWRRPVDVCAKSKYCLEFKYHRQGAKLNKSVSVPSQNMNSTSVAGLDSCSAKYLFYLIVYEDELCSLPVAARWTTGPFVLPSQQIVYDSLRVRVLNFNSTVYWKQSESCSLKSTQFSVYYRSAERSQNWSRSYCIVKTDIDNVFCCEFLTCAEMPKDHSYEVQIRVGGERRENTENVRIFYPSLENIPDQIPHITISALTSTSVQVAWKLAPSFCSKFPYCLTFLYHSDSENKSVEVTKDEQNRSSTIVHNLLPYTKYYFYAITFHPGLACFYQPGFPHGATGPFTGTTLEGVPSSSPVVICSLCDVILHGKRRDGTVRWQLPPKDKWNGLPRLFLIQWRVKLDKNISQPVWNNKTILKPRATEGNLTGLFLTFEYLVRVKMCNGNERCSVFSREMIIEIFKKTEESDSETSHTRTIAVSVGVTLAVLVVVIFGITLFLKIKKYKLRTVDLRTSAQLPSLGCLSAYENIGSMTMPTYSQLLQSPTDDCYPVETESPEPDKKPENSSQAEEDSARISTAKMDL